jgi:hypothetical protein
MAWVKASPLSRNLTKVYGGGKSIGSDANACELGIGDRLRLQLPFLRYWE